MVWLQGLLTWGLGDVTKDKPVFCFSSIFYGIGFTKGTSLSLMMSGASQALMGTDVQDHIQGEGLRAFSGISLRGAKNCHYDNFPENLFSHLTLLRGITCPPLNQSL